jgi:hypothetical protein
MWPDGGIRESEHRTDKGLDEEKDMRKDER